MDWILYLSSSIIVYFVGKGMCFTILRKRIMTRLGEVEQFLPQSGTRDEVRSFFRRIFELYAFCQRSILGKFILTSIEKGRASLLESHDVLIKSTSQQAETWLIFIRSTMEKSAIEILPWEKCFNPGAITDHQALSLDMYKFQNPKLPIKDVGELIKIISSLHMTMIHLEECLKQRNDSLWRDVNRERQTMHALIPQLDEIKNKIDNTLELNRFNDYVLIKEIFDYYESPDFEKSLNFYFFVGDYLNGGTHRTASDMMKTCQDYFKHAKRFTYLMEEKIEDLSYVAKALGFLFPKPML